MRKLLCVLIVLGFVAPTLADDFAPPLWRDDPLWYYAEWDMFVLGDFSAGINPDFEDSLDDSDPATYLYNAFSTHLDFDASDGWSLEPPQGGGIINPERDASFVANVVNWVDWLPEKYLRVQVTFTDGGNGAPDIVGADGFGPVSGGDPHQTLIDPPMFVDANHVYWDMIILPNPDWEQIEFFLPMGTSVDQLIIESVSVPEPVTLGLMAFGAVALLKRRR
jgi:hypothetical protein